MTNPEYPRLTKAPHAGDIPANQGGETPTNEYSLSLGEANQMYGLTETGNIPELNEGIVPVTEEERKAAREAILASRNKNEKKRMSLGKRILAVVGIGTVVGGGIGAVVAATSGSENTSTSVDSGETNTIPTPTTAIEAGATNTVITTAEVTPAATEPVISGDHGGSTAEVTTPAPTTAVETAPVAGEGMSEAEVARLTAMNSGEFLANTTYGQRVEYGAIKVAERQDKTLKQANTEIARFGETITLPVPASPTNTGQEIYNQGAFKYATITNTVNLDVTGVMDSDAYNNSIPEMTKLTSSYVRDDTSFYNNTLSKLTPETLILVNVAKVTSETEVSTATSGNFVKKIQYTLLDQRIEETYEFQPFNPENPNEGEWVIVFSQKIDASTPPLEIVNAN